MAAWPRGGRRGAPGLRRGLGDCDGRRIPRRCGRCTCGLAAGRAAGRAFVADSGRVDRAGRRAPAASAVGVCVCRGNRGRGHSGNRRRIVARPGAVADGTGRRRHIPQRRPRSLWPPLFQGPATGQPDIGRGLVRGAPGCTARRAGHAVDIMRRRERSEDSWRTRPHPRVRRAQRRRSGRTAVRRACGTLRWRRPPTAAIDMAGLRS